MHYCKAGCHKFLHLEIPPKTDPQMIARIGCHKCDLEVWISNKLSAKDLAWAKGVVREAKQWTN